MSDEQTGDVDAISTGHASSAEPAARQDRRSHGRRRVERLAYIRFDKDNGGILLDIGEGGLKFQGIASSLEGEFCVVKFMLPGSGRTIEVRGQITWSNKSRKGGGVRFVDIPEDVRQQIREWMAQENTSLIPTRPVPKPIVSKPPIFLTRERVKAGSSASTVSQPVMPSLSAVPVATMDSAARTSRVVPVAPVASVVPVAPEVHADTRASLTPLPVETIAPAAKSSDTVVVRPKVAQVEVAQLPVPPPALGPKRVSVPEEVVETARATAPALVVPYEPTTKPVRASNGTLTSTPAPAAAQTFLQALEEPLKTTDWSHPATLPRPESLLAADFSALKYGKPSGGSGVAQIVVVAAFVCAAAAAVVVVTPRTLALLASFRGISQASTSSPVAAPVPVAVDGQDFTVDAMNSANRHWMLQNGGDVAAAGAPSNSISSNLANGVQNTELGDLPGNLSGNASNNLLGIASDGVRAAASQSLAGRGVTVQPRISALLASSAAQHLDLQPPNMRRVTVSSTGLDAPPVADGASSANLLESRGLASSSPSLPAPPPVVVPAASTVPAASAPATAAAAVSKSALRPAVLIHSVRAVYPTDVAQSKPGSPVRVSAVIDKNGVPMSLKMVSGDPSLSGAVFAAVREYRYDPALLNGEPVESTVVIAVNFQQPN